jgi:DNA repair exonuclease SbcCD ATPase subunit
VAEEKTIKKAERDIAASTDHVCYTCGQSITDKKHTELLGKKKDAIAAATAVMDDINGAILELKKEFDSIEIADTAPKPEYASAQDAYNYKTKLSAAKHSLTTLDELVDPYTDQINQLTLTGMQAIDWSEVNRLQEILEHQDFLMKLLTNKDSFIRKKIISQNLAHLNLRLENYLIDLGLPHDVAFQSDLSVSITELGRDLDFDNLSRGERNRLILGLSWAFRDVYETANTPIDFLVIDELMDSGLDSSGVENALGILKKMHRERNKNIFLISHREELLNRVNNILYVSKENGFTSFSMSQDSEIE